MDEKRRISGANALLDALVAEGVDTVFGYPGGSIIPIYDALYDYGGRLPGLREASAYVLRRRAPARQTC